MAVGRFADAAKEALKVLEQVPDSGDAIILLTEAARSKEDLEVGKGQLEKFPKKNDVSFHLASANLFFHSGDPAAAGNALRQALSVDPKSSQAHMAMGDLYLFQKDQKQAAEEFKKAADLAPVRSIERLKYAAFKSTTGGAEETRRISTEMTKQAPDYLPGWILLAERSLKDKKYDDSLSLLETVSSRDPENVDGRRLQSDVLLAKGDTQKAVDAFGATRPNPIRTLPSSNTNWHGIFQNKNTNQAAVALIRPSQSIRTYDDAVLMLAGTNFSTGHGEKVIEPSWTRLREKGPISGVPHSSLAQPMARLIV